MSTVWNKHRISRTAFNNYCRDAIAYYRSILKDVAIYVSDFGKIMPSDASREYSEIGAFKILFRL